jgi:hypothetical protein
MIIHKEILMKTASIFMQREAATAMAMLASGILILASLR